MFPTVQVLLLYLIAEGYGLHHHPSNQAGFQGAGFAGYSAAAVPYQGYNAYNSPPQPYNIGYDNEDKYGNRQFRSEQGDSRNAKTGSYGYRDVNGLYRRVNYVADAYGFRATVESNKPGTAPGVSADAAFNAAPVVPPVPSGAAQSGAPTAGVVVPYNAGGYASYGKYNPYAGAAGAYAYAPFRRQGYPASSPARGGYAYGGQSPYSYGATGYGASNGPSVYGAPAGYGSWPSTHHGYRRR